MIQIEKADNGYIVQRDGHNKKVYLTIDDLFRELLLRLEGLERSATGSYYGEVKILREESKPEPNWDKTDTVPCNAQTVGYTFDWREDQT